MNEDIEDSLSSKVYETARNANAMTLYVLLKNLSSTKANKIINETIDVEDEGQRTPLMIAAELRHERVIKMLLSEFEPDLEKEGIFVDSFERDGDIYAEGATALSCAIRSGYLKGVELLVEAGADVNHATRINVTPLRTACRKGHLNIVKYLMDHSDNINIADTYNSTCLMIAAKNGHLRVVSLLLKNKADPNMRDICGTTALHYAAENGHMSILKKLLNYNANFSANNIGMTPIKLAAESKYEEIVEYLCSRPEISKEEKIEALELFGASCRITRDNNYCGKAYKYLHRAMEMRYSDPDNIIEKKLIKPIPAYENWVESRNLLELEAVECNSNGLDMEALTIRERILGQHNPSVPYAIRFIGEVFADNFRYERCMELYLHAMHLKQLNKVSADGDLLKFAELLDKMSQLWEEVTYDKVVRVLAVAIVELERSKSMNVSPASSVSDKEDIERSMLATLYFLMTLANLFNECNEEEILNINRMVSMLNHLQVKLYDGKTLLHMACGICPYSYVHDLYNCYPCDETARLLIQCGADVNAMDYNRNTPFHLIVRDFNCNLDYMEIQIQIIKDLAEAGAHVYCLINQDKTSMNSKIASIAEKLQTQGNVGVTSLKCIAAIAVKSLGLSYQGQVPQALEPFIELHSAVYLEIQSDYSEFYDDSTLFYDMYPRD